MSELLKKMEYHALNFLSVREYGDLELRNKLFNKFKADFDELELNQDLDIFLQKSIKKGYLSNERYIQSIIKLAETRGYGLYKILYKYKNNVSVDLEQTLKQYLGDDDLFWLRLVRQVLKKKFNTINLKELSEYKDLEKQKLKMLNFLLNRGFSNTEARQAIEDV